MLNFNPARANPLSLVNLANTASLAKPTWPSRKEKMITLIAESKTMRTDLLPVKAPRFPEGEAQADEICARIASMSVAQIAEALKVSPTMALRSRQMALGFPDKRFGLPAVDAFTGVVFRYLDPASFDAAARDFAAHNLRIVSSLYSLLRPDDMVRPYRTDYSSRVAPGDVPLCRWQKGKSTIRLVAALREEGTSEILDLMPAEAAKCFDWKVLRKFAKRHEVRLREMVDAHTIRTPSSNRLKQMRGLLLREIIEKRITSTEELKRLDSDNFVYTGEDEEKGVLTFLC